MNDRSSRKIFNTQVKKSKTFYLEETPLTDYQSWEIPIKLVSEANLKEYWTKTHERHKMYKGYIDSAFIIKPIRFKPPVTIEFVRVAPRQLDFDNLVYAFKFIRDTICAKLIPGLSPGRADSSKLITCEYNQTKGKPNEHGIKIVIYKNENNHE